MRLIAGLGALACVHGCASPPPARPVPVPVAAAPVAPPPRLPAWTYWEEVEVPLVPGVPVAGLPIDTLLRSGAPGAEARWSLAPPALREAIRTRGFAVTRSAHPLTRIGDFYAALRDDRVPWVVTLDALFFVAHLAMERAHAEVDEVVIEPSMRALLRRLDTRLTEGSRGSISPDMASAVLVARGVVAVGLALAQPDYAPPAELAALVEGEKSRVLSHSAVGVSPWLGVPLDYTGMSPRGQADSDEKHASVFRAMAWLQGASLALEGRGEDEVRMPVDIATARIHARAALLLSRLIEHDVDAEAASAWARIARAGDLLVGDADDTTPRDLEASASTLGLDLRNADWFANVTSVDRVRRAAVRAHPARVDDGAGGAYAPATGLDPARPLGRIAPTFRLLGPRLTPDSEVLQSVVFPVVGLLSRAEPPPTSRDGRRAMPCALDVAAWLGSAEARAALHDSGDDAYAGYPETLDRLVRARPAQGSIERHRTPYLSSLDTLQTWVAPSAGDRVQPAATTPEWRARKAAVALGAWTELRHDAVPMSRVQIASIPLPPRAPGDTVVPIFVEPHPEAIADLLALVRQTSRALMADGAITPAGPADVALQEAQELLWEALGVAVHEASDQPVPPEMVAALAGFPGRLRALEAALGSPGGADVPLVVDVHTDVTSAAALEEATGHIEELWVVMREPGTHRQWLALGASLPHVELSQPMATRLSDTSWGARLGQDEPPPEPLERAYFIDSR
jgi:hypothetical protein